MTCYFSIEDFLTSPFGLLPQPETEWFMTLDSLQMPQKRGRSPFHHSSMFRPCQASTGRTCALLSYHHRTPNPAKGVAAQLARFCCRSSCTSSVEGSRFMVRLHRGKRLQPKKSPYLPVRGTKWPPQSGSGQGTRAESVPSGLSTGIPSFFNSKKNCETLPSGARSLTDLFARVIATYRSRLSSEKRNVSA